MKRRFPGLNLATQPAEAPDGIYLVPVYRAQYRRHAQKPGGPKRPRVAVT
jgi:hypothetical protein